MDEQEKQAADTTFISHDHDKAAFEALGYARGSADASGIPTAGGKRWVNAPLAFARAYADYRLQGYAHDIRTAYENWQRSDGRAVKSTELIRAQELLRRISSMTDKDEAAQFTAALGSGFRAESQAATAWAASNGMWHWQSRVPGDKRP